MKENEIDRLLADIIAGEEVAGEDRELLETWKECSLDNKQFEGEVQRLGSFGKDMKHRKEKTYLFERIEHVVEERRRKQLFIRRISVVACFVLIVGMVVFYALLPEERREAVAPTIKPSYPHAELILSQGETVVLDSSVCGLLDSHVFLKMGNSQNTLIYYPRGEYNRIVYHTIIVPYGAEYTLQLSDNTKVYLNSGSSLRYPVNFQGGIREVELSGEGYFEVSKDSLRPFVVKAEEIDVKVLGTSFNIAVYSGAKAISTTLVEGKIQVTRGGCEWILRPGMQFLHNVENGISETRMVDTEMYTSWKDGYYYFKKETLENIMDNLARWYDLDVSYQSTKLRKLEFGGRLKRYEDINYLLNKMEETQDVEFIVRGKTITVKQKTD